MTFRNRTRPAGVFLAVTHVTPAFLASFTLTGCGAAPLPGPEPPPTAPQGLVEPSTPVPVQEPCDDGTINVEAAPAGSVCEDPGSFWPGSCKVPIVITVTDCTSSLVQISEIVLAGEGWTTIQWTHALGWQLLGTTQLAWRFQGRRQGMGGMGP